MAERYLSPSGSDSNTGSLASPWKTLAGAHARIAAGDTLRAAAGEYYGGFLGSKPVHLRVAEGAEVRIARRDKTTALSLDTWTGGSIDGAGGRLVIGPVATPSTSDGSTQSAALQLPGSRGVHVANLVAESGADVGILLTRNAAGVAAADLLLEDIEATGNGEGIRVNGGSGHLIRRARTHHNGRMVVSAKANSFGAVGLVLDRCDGVKVEQLTSHDNVAPNPEQYGLDGGAAEIYGATRCTIDGLEAFGNEGVLETGGPKDGSAVPEGNVLRNFRVTGPIHQGSYDSPAFLLRASRGMVIEDGLIDVTGPGDVFRWAADSWGGDWSGSVLRRIVIRAPGATVFQTYGRPLGGVTREEVYVLPDDLLALAQLSEDAANDALRIASAADAAATAAAATVAAAEARAEVALEAAQRLARLSRLAAG